MVSRERVGSGGVISFCGAAIGVVIFCVQFELDIHRVTIRTADDYYRQNWMNISFSISLHFLSLLFFFWKNFLCKLVFKSLFVCTRPYSLASYLILNKMSQVLHINGLPE